MITNPVQAATSAKGTFLGSASAIGRAVGFAPEVSSEDASWSNLALFAWRGHCDLAEFEPFHEPVIIYHVGGAQSVAVRKGGNWRQRTHPGLITIIPPNTRVAWDIRGEVFSRSVHLGSRFLSSPLADDGGRAPELQFRCGVKDPLIASVIGALERQLRAPSQIGSLYADSVADMLALHLMSLHAEGSHEVAFRGGLSGSALRRSMDRLHASIGTGVSLQALADEAGLSRTYFADAFRKATGLAPHRYLTRIRLEQARDLLLTTTHSITEIALRCGFSSQAHLSTVFREAYGVSPRKFRGDNDAG